jgi:GNAT superfamily N-acetyltransferase
MFGRIEGPLLNRGKVCGAIIDSLPEWFGMPESNAQYVRDIDGLPTFIAFDEGQAIGFVTAKLNNVYTAELVVMGVLPDFQHQGIGRALLIQMEAYLRRSHVEYIHVKTLGPSHPDPYYAETRYFYHAVGFRPLEEFKGIWNEDNPCLIMVKALR